MLIFIQMVELPYNRDVKDLPNLAVMSESLVFGPKVLLFRTLSGQLPRPHTQLSSHITPMKEIRL